MSIQSSTEASPALVIKSDSEDDYPENPIEVQLPTTSLGLSLLSDNSVPVIFYQVYTPEGVKAGIFETGFTLLNGFVKFSSDYFGSFQLFYIDVIPEKNEVVVEKKQLKPGSVQINSGNLFSQSLEVNLTLGSEEASQMYVTNTVDCGDGGEWEAYNAAKAWKLSQPNSQNYVYAKFQDDAGNESPCIGAMITHDDEAPKDAGISIDEGVSHTSATAVTLSLTASDASEVYISNNESCSAGGIWQPYANLKAWTLAQNNDTATVYVKFKDAAGNESSCLSDSIIHDDIAPADTSFSIDGGAENTTSKEVSLVLTATDASEMYISNSADCIAGGTWEAYTTTKAWSLGQSNERATVYVKFKDVAGNESTCLSASITHDDVGPTTTSISIENGADRTNSAAVTLNLAGSDASHMYITNDPSCAAGGAWEVYSSSKVWTLAQTNDTATVYIKFKDALSNESTCISDSITHDDLAPTAVVINIDNGADYATSTGVTLELNATDAHEMYVTNTSGCSADGTWEAYSTSKAWILGQTNAAATVYIKYRDAAGNESACINDTITHDDTAPTSTSISIDGGASSTNNSAVTLTLAATDAAEMYVTNTSACSADGTWEAYSTSKPWTLGQTDGTATVYIKFKDAAGNESDCVDDTITHVTPGPTGTSISIDSDASYATSASVSLSLGATGATQMYVTNDAGCSTGGTWEAFSTLRSWTIAQTNDTATVYVKYKDSSNDESACISDTIVHDNLAPSGTSISIDSGATYATTTAVTLTLGATEASDMYVTNTTGCSGGGTWEAYATLKAWTLGQTNSTATVYIKYRDIAGNESSCINDTISHDDTPPSGTLIDINAGASHTTTSSVSLTLAAAEASFMYITNTAGCASDGIWEAYGTSKAWSLGQTNALATVYVRYKDAAGNLSTCLSDTITHDDTAPTGTSVSINGGSTSTNATSTTLTITASGASEMYITNTAACTTGGTWEAYASSRVWTLAQTNSVATVYAKFRDAAGNESSCSDDTINHDDTAPTGEAISIEGGASYANSDTVSLTLSVTGASEMYVTNTSGCTAGGAWEAYNGTRAWTLGQTNGIATVYVKYRDDSGNESPCASDAITHDDTAPSGTSINIDGGATHTSTTAVTLTLTATDATEMYVTNTSACSADGSWEAYTTSKAWTLRQTNDTASVYVKFRDAAGNESSCINDTIIHDNTAPSGTSISIHGGTSYVNSISVNLTLTASDVNEMYITNTLDCSTGGTWEAYASSKAWTLGQTNSVASVYAKFRDAAGNESSCIQDTITHDDTAPIGESITIDSGAIYATSDAVNLSLSVIGASEMYVTNTSGCSADGTWEAYSGTKAWTLGQTNGIATVYVKYRDDAGNEGPCASDTITHDSSGPTGTSISIDGGAYTSSTSVNLSIAATDASEMYLSNTSGCSTGGTWEAYTASRAWTIGQTNATATVYVKFRDIAGNESSCINDDITHDDIAPSPVAMNIDGGETHTNSLSVPITLTASGASQMYLTNTSGCSTGGTWEAFASSRVWTLGQSNATATVYAKFKDAAGNESLCTGDNIIHDDTAPAGSMYIDSDAPYATSSGVTLNLSATAATYMYITNTAGCSTDGTWEAFTATKSWTLSQNNTTATVYVKYKDEASNESTCYNDTITHDDTAPSPTSFDIDGGAMYTNVPSVTLNLIASGASEMLISDTGDCSAGTWEPYTSTKAWTLAITNAAADVSVKYKDAAGNESSCSSDSITHDDLVPSSPAVDDGIAFYKSSVKVFWDPASDAGSGIASYEVAIGTSSGGDDIIPWTDVGLVTNHVWTGLQLVAGNTYYGSVRINDHAGNSIVSFGSGFNALGLWTQTPSIAAGGDFFAGQQSCAILSNGALKCWGENDLGELGQEVFPNFGDDPDEMGAYLKPIKLGSGLSAKAIAAGAAHTCAILSNDQVKCWGYNNSGQLGIGDTTLTGDHAGEMGDSLPIVNLGSGRTALSVTAGSDHSCALLDDGTVKCWGDALVGQLGLGDTNSIGDNPGEMGDTLAPINFGSVGNVTSITSGSDHTCALFIDNSVKCWGDSQYGQLGLNDTITRGDHANEMGDNLPPVYLGTGRSAQSISAGGYHTCAILDNNQVKCWGDNSSGQLGIGNLNTFGDGAHPMGGLPSVNLGTGRTAIAISAGVFHTCAILDNNQVACWGEGLHGKLGRGDTNDIGDQPGEMGDSLVYIPLGGGRFATEIAAGRNHTCAKLDNDTVKCWGSNEAGQLGQGHTGDLGDQPGEMGTALPVVDL